jgi:hypothetical protein
VGRLRSEELLTIHQYPTAVRGDRGNKTLHRPTPLNPSSFLSLSHRSALHRDAQRRFNGDDGNDAECWRHREPTGRRMRPPEGRGATVSPLIGACVRPRVEAPPLARSSVRASARGWRRRRRAASWWCPKAVTGHAVSSVNCSSGALLPVHEVRGLEDSVGGYYIRGKLPLHSC